MYGRLMRVAVLSWLIITVTFLLQDYASDGVIMISFDEMSSQSEPGTPEKPMKKKARGR